jgi:Uma2 family endonuclease
MHRALTEIDADPAEPRYHGLRMSAAEYLQLEDDGFRYELIDGVVYMSPSPTRRHQTFVTNFAAMLVEYVDVHPLGEVSVETDVHLATQPDGRDLVYRPDIIFLRAQRAAENPDFVQGAPDLAIEVIPNRTRRLDTVTKWQDYERFGVHEYWMFDPSRGTTTFLRLREGRYIEIAPLDDRFASEAIPGFVLDLKGVRALFPQQT